jgi:hypothetical protein
MTSRMRLSRYGAIALCAIAQCAFGTPSRVPDPGEPPAIAAAPAAAPLIAGQEIDDQPALRDRLIAVFPLDGEPLRDGGIRHPGDTRVAEPSTLLLVSLGLFGLIAWSRRRR